MANFDANEIKRQASRINEQTEKFINSCNSIIKDLDVLKDLVKSEDSDLSNLLFTLETDYEIVHGSVEKKFAQLAAIMNNWADKTIENQRALEEKLRKRNQDFE
ncbi:MAG: hypothetical protein K2H20_03305, partial [Bacilli bacterium]|nr:hypothetical protein [Bacilli bacterium]